jgi:hypothetical protein
MRTELNDLEKLSDHRILCRTADELTAVFKELDKQGYTWPGNRPLIGSFSVNAPIILFTYKHGVPGKTDKGKKTVLQSTDAVGITPENRIVTAAQWLRENRFFNGVDCTVPEGEA